MADDRLSRSVPEGQETCQRCGEDGYDRRTLWMKCFYAMAELNIPFSIKDGYFTLRVCKDCRASWMGAIKEWFESPAPTRDGRGSGIFVRENGATVEISESEWALRYPDRVPVRVRP